MAEETNDNIELRSEEVQEVMGMIPSWIVRWGITLLFGVIVLLLIGSCFFRYPDVLTTEMTLSSRNQSLDWYRGLPGKSAISA